MEIKFEAAGGTTVVQLIGSLDTQTSPGAQEKLTQLIENGATKIVVDLEGLDYISSAGLRVLFVAAKQLQGVDGEIRVCNLNPVVKEVFDISGFEMILPVSGTRTEALDGF